MGRLKPLVQGDFAVLENRPDLARKLLRAIPAALKADPTTINRGDPINAPAMGANRTVRPKNGL
jgi:hypothetical protein